MNKLLSAASALGMLLAVNAAQADVLTAEQMDTITAGAPPPLTAVVATGITGGSSSGNYALLDNAGVASAQIQNTFTCLSAGCRQVQTAAAAPGGLPPITIQ